MIVTRCRAKGERYKRDTRPVRQINVSLWLGTPKVKNISVIWTECSQHFSSRLQNNENVNRGRLKYIVILFSFI